MNLPTQLHAFLHDAAFQPDDAIDAAIDEVISRFDSWMEAGDWDSCVRVLNETDVDSIAPEVSLAMLSMTFVERHARLHVARSAFFSRVLKKFVKDMGREEAEEELRGLE